MILQEIERQIGFAPNNANSTGAVALAIAGVPGTRDMICTWLRRHGIKPISMVTALDLTIARAYCNEQYRATWLRA